VLCVVPFDCRWKIARYQVRADDCTSFDCYFTFHPESNFKKPSCIRDDDRSRCVLDLDLGRGDPERGFGWCQPSSRGYEVSTRKAQAQDIRDRVRDILVDDKMDQVDGSWSHDSLAKLLSLHPQCLSLPQVLAMACRDSAAVLSRAVVDFHSLKIRYLQQMEVYLLLHVDPCNSRSSLPFTCTLTRDCLCVELENAFT